MAKTKEQKPDVENAPEQKPVDIQNDEHRGIGGRYVFDAATGKRTRVAGPDLETAPVQATESNELPETEALNNESQ